MSDAAWIPFASVHDAASRLGLNQGHVSAVVNGRQKTVGNGKKRYEFMLDKAAAEPEILVDDEGRREEWRPVKKWEFVKGGTWVDIFADLSLPETEKKCTRQINHRNEQSPL